ncbi:MAG: tail fiber domain-containing protein, partial [Candidatus Babeliales bacterium]
FPLLVIISTKSKENKLTLTKLERDVVLNNLEDTYAYLGDELSNIGHVVKQMTKSDDTKLQEMYELNDHLNAGYKIGSRDEVEKVLTKALEELDNDDLSSQELVQHLEDILKKLQDNKLNIEVKHQQTRSVNEDEDSKNELELLVQNMPIIVDKEGVTRDPLVQTIDGCLEVTNDALIGRNLTVENDLLIKNDAAIRGELEVCDEAKFKKKVKFKKDVSFRKDVEIEGDLQVEGDVAIESDLEVDGDTELKNANVEGNLSVQEDLVVCGDAEFKGSVVDVACDLFVGCNIFMKNTNSPVGNIYKDGVRFIHNFGTENTFVGIEAGNFTMTAPAIRNSAFGVLALTNNTSGFGNTAGGFSALRNNEDGTENTAFGSNALRENRSGISNTAMGQGSLRFNVSGIRNSGLGDNSLNTNITGNNNTATGFGACGFNLTGDANTGCGFFAVNQNELGSGNTGVGEAALRDVQGNRNIALGQRAGRNLAEGDDNIYIGAAAGGFLDNSVTESLQIRIGSSQTDCYIQGIFGNPGAEEDVPVFVSENGKLTTAVISSLRYKNDVIDMGTTSEGLMELRPVTFSYKHENSNKRHYGLIAEEVKKVFPELVVQDNNGNVYSVRYHELPAMLLNELQKDRETIKLLQDTVKILRNNQQKSNDTINELLARLIALEEIKSK